ncbi:MAG: hypothetical protein HKM93_16510 [Desulfobacteraceae bacterium]|nr:hypothetical protein [Desulfobacteraceae bacterium]
MKQHREVYLRHPPERDILFVLGAGASHPDGVPLQKDILPVLFDTGNGNINQSRIGQELQQFLTDNFYIDTRKREYPKLEAVFGFLDYFILQNESLNAGYSLSRLLQIKENLIKIIHYIVNLKTDQHSPTYHRFWKTIAASNRNVSIITLNYDTLLEQAFDPLFRTVGYIDYCMHLMNYERCPGLTEYNFWVNPKEPVQVTGDEPPASFNVLKLHGSLNWKYCNCCNQTLLTTWDRTIDLNRGMFVGYTIPDNREYDYVCPLDRTEFQTLIMPPSYMKSLNNPVLAHLFGEAARELRAARKIIFIGYSLSDADVHIKALFRKNLMPATELVVVNPKQSDTIRHQYHALSDRMQFLPVSFETFISDPEMMTRLIIK